jgi:broad specificity phosphatase PhoE
VTIAAGTRIAIVRHGESVSNASGLIAGHAGCAGLTELGALQVQALAERLARTGELAEAVALYSSILRRAVETADLLAAALGDPPRVSTCRLCEQHPGEADGMTWADYESTYGEVPADRGPDWRLSPGGESWVELLDRAASELQRIAGEHPGELVVIASHGGVVDASMIRLLRLPDHGTATSLHPTNASITEWRHTGSRWRLVRYNDSAHLAGLTTAPGAGALAWEVSPVPVAPSARPGGQPQE